MEVASTQMQVTHNQVPVNNRRRRYHPMEIQICRFKCL